MFHAVTLSMSGFKGNDYHIRFHLFNQDFQPIAKHIVDMLESILKEAQRVEDKKDPYGDEHDINDSNYLDYVKRENLPYLKFVEFLNKYRKNISFTANDIKSIDYTNIGPFWINTSIHEINSYEELEDYVATVCYSMGEYVDDKLKKLDKPSELIDVLNEVEKKFNDKTLSKYD